MTDFEIGSNDQGIVFHMTPATGSGGAPIDDTTTAGDKTWSSLKIANELDGKVDKEQGKGLSSNDYTAEEKQKLAGVEAEANKTVVDDALSGTSTNPVQNRVVKNALDQKANSTTVSQLSETIGNLSTAVSGKYAKPSGGIPSTDMSEAVQTSLEKADTALQEHQDISGKQNKPAVAGTAGQVLGLDENLNPVWKTPYPQNYELIEDITLTEDTDALLINKFSDNSDLILTDFIMECDFKAVSATSYLGAQWVNSNRTTMNLPTGQMLTTSDQTTFYWSERYGSLVKMFADRPYGLDSTSSQAQYYYNLLSDSPTIRGVRLYKYNSTSSPIPSGSRIRLWGVRA